MVAYERVLGLGDRDRTTELNPVLRDALIEALHRAQRIAEADELHAEAKAERREQGSR